MASDIKYTEADIKALQDMASTLNRGTPVLTGGSIHPDIPTIDSVGPGRRINTVGRVEHVGWGCMAASMGPGQDRITFDAGGAMYRADSFSWTYLGGPAMAAGYDMNAAQRAVRDLLNAAPK